MIGGILSRGFLAVTTGLCLSMAGAAQAQTTTITSLESFDGLLQSWGPGLDAGTVGGVGQTFTAPNAALPIVTLPVARVEDSGDFSYRGYILPLIDGRVPERLTSLSPVARTSLLSISETIGATAPQSATVRLEFTGGRLTRGQQYVVVLAPDPMGATDQLAAAQAGFIFGDVIPGMPVIFDQNGDLIAGYDDLISSVDLAIELVFAPRGPDAANTLLGLEANAGAVRGVLTQRAAAATFALDNDCSVFDTYGLCVSVGFRTSQIGNEYHDSGEAAGLLSMAYRVTPQFRFGGFIDQSLTSNTPAGVDAKNTQPMLGAFAVYQQSANFAGLTFRAALAHQQGDLRITRPELENTEAGTGSAATSVLAFGAELAYGFPLEGSWVAQPYTGLRRSDSSRRGYTEATSETVEFPITYSRYGQVVTSATAGLRLRGEIAPRLGVTLGAGVEYDLDSKMDRYAGTSAIPDLETFSIATNQQQNELRGVGTFGMRYMIAANQALAMDASIRQLPYGSDLAATTMLRYSIGF